MRRLGTLALLAVVVVGAAGVSRAETVPSFPSLGDVVNGYAAVHFYNRDRSQSTGYVATVDGTYTRTAAGGSWSGPGVLTELSDPAFQKLLPGENTWGIFAVRVIEAGTTATPNEIFKKLGGDITYEWTETNIMTGDTALVGVVWGGWDSKVIVSNGGNNLEIFTEDLHFELWAVDKALVNLEGSSQGPRYDPNWRTAFNRYTGWVTGAGTLLLDGNSTYHRFVGTQQISPLQFDGQTVVYFDVPASGAGLWNPFIAGNNYFIDPLGNLTDMKLTFDIDPGLNNWSANSHDDGGTLFAIPEPLTMLGFAMAGLGAGRYLRRRLRSL